MASLELTETLWLGNQTVLSLAQLADLSGWTEAELREWVEEGVIAPLDLAAEPWLFGADRLVTVRLAWRLRHDFELDRQGLALTLALLERVRALEAELRELKARLPVYR